MPNDNPIYIGSVPSSTDNPKYMGSFSGAGGGGGSGTVTVGGGGAGTVNQIPKFSAATAIVDSIARESGSSIIVVGSVVAEGFNSLTIAPSTTGNPVTLMATGSDADVAIRLITKGILPVIVGGPTFIDPYSGLPRDFLADRASLVVGGIFDYGTASQAYGTLNSITLDAAADSGTSVHSFNTNVQIPVTNTKNYGSLYGMEANIVHSGSGNVAAQYGVSIDVSNYGPGNIPDIYGIFVNLENTHASGTVDRAYSFVAGDFFTGGTTGTLYQYYSSNIAGAATNGYYFWADSRGVLVIKEDNTFDSVGQAIARVYNPLFTKYTAGAADYERTVFGQWNGNVAEIGTEKGGTGTLRDLRLLGQLRSFTIADGNNIVLNTTTGTKIGTATTQKLGFYNATPVVQGASVADASGGAIIDAEARTAINALISRIEATGLIATV